MGDNNILPRGGFLRGILAGLILIFFAFVGLSVYFPLPVEIGPTPTPVTELENATTIPVLEPEDSSGGISASMETPTTSQAPETPAPIAEASPGVVVAPLAAEPVNSVSALEPMPTSNDIEIGTNESSSPIIVTPVAPVIEVEEVVEEPVVEAASEEPEVSTDLIESPMVNEVESNVVVSTETEVVATTESIVEPAEGLELSGQTLIQTDEPEVDTEVAPETPVGAFMANSAEFVDDGDAPLLSVILLATSVSEAQTVASIPAPLTLAVASDNPEADDIIEAYRALGGEVVLLLPVDGPNVLGNGGDPLNVPDQLNAIMANATGVIGILDGPEGDLNQDNRMLEGIYAKLSETGHAMMTFNGLGLNRASVMADESGIPATGIARQIDTSQGTIAVVRELDKVVLQLGDQRSVTVYAPATADMLFGLNFWLDSQKAQLVTVAPVSASIQRK